MPISTIPRLRLSNGPHRGRVPEGASTCTDRGRKGEGGLARPRHYSFDFVLEIF